MSIAQELLILKDKIAKDKDKRNRLEGQRAQILSDLKKEFSVTSVDAAQKLLNKMTVESDKLSADLRRKLDKIKTRYLSGEGD